MILSFNLSLAFQTEFCLKTKLQRSICNNQVTAVAGVHLSSPAGQPTAPPVHKYAEYYNRYEQDKYRIRSNMITYNSNLFSLCSILFPYASKIFLIYHLFVYSKYFCGNFWDSQESLHQSRIKTLFRQCPVAFITSNYCFLSHWAKQQPAKWIWGQLV